MQKIEENPSLPPLLEDVLLKIEVDKGDINEEKYEPVKRWIFGRRFKNGEGGDSYELYNYKHNRSPFIVVGWKPLPELE